jgi:hypothetical protein
MTMVRPHVEAMQLDDETDALAKRVNELERGSSTLDDWMRAEARVGAVMLVGQHMLSNVETSRSSVGDIRARLGQLRLLRLSVQSRIYEHQVTAHQKPAMRFS